MHAVAAHVRGDSRPLVGPPRAYPRDALLLSTAVPTIAFAGVTEVPAGGVGDRRARDPGVRRRLVVHRPAGLRPAGAAPVRRGDGALLPVAGRGARGRPLRPCPRARPLRDRRPRGRAGLDGRLGDRRRGGDREPQPLLVARRPARAVARRPGRGPAAVRRAAAARARPRLPGAGRQRVAAVPLGDHARRRARAGHRPTSPTSPAGTCWSARPRRSWPCTRRSPCSRSTTGPACVRLAAWADRARASHPARGRRATRPGAGAAARRAMLGGRRRARPAVGRRTPSRRLRRPARAGRGDPDLRAAAGRPVRRGPRRARRPAGPPPLAARPSAGARPASSRPRGPLRPA